MIPDVFVSAQIEIGVIRQSGVGVFGWFAGGESDVDDVLFLVDDVSHVDHLLTW